MAEPISAEPPAPPRPRFREVIEQAERYRVERGIEPLTEDEAMELALAETRRVRAERLAGPVQRGD